MPLIITLEKNKNKSERMETFSEMIMFIIKYLPKKLIFVFKEALHIGGDVGQPTEDGSGEQN